ncbi:MAG: peptidylprolyl isomerase [Pirellulales bacterium]|nr:peptidylprolyl isomerase [Pirellulales bacterium]
MTRKQGQQPTAFLPATPRTEARRQAGQERIQPGAWKRRWGYLFGGLLVIGLCVMIRHLSGGPEKADATMPREAEGRTARTAAETLPSPQPTKALMHHGRPVPAVVATVNGRPITREELARECLRHYGTEVLDSLVKKYLVMQECRRRGLDVSREEVDQEIERLAKNFKIPVDQWLKMIKSESGVTYEQYAEDIIQPRLALKKIADADLQITREELVHEHEIMYGEMIRARLISVKSKKNADQLHAMVLADPESFGDVAQANSEDKPSAAAKGLIQPIRRHGSFPEIEQAAFSMADGEISPVIHVADQYVILKREGSIPPRNVKLEDVAEKLENLIRVRKMRSLADEIFRTLSENARVEKFFHGLDAEGRIAGVAATINGQPMISLEELARACVDRHGTEVLEGTINRTLLELECRKRGVTVNPREMDEEIGRAALLGVPPKSDGSPDVEAWLEEVTRQQNISQEIYRRDAVWPSVALRKLAAANVTVTQEDLQRGFEANYGPRARCLAIVLNSPRHAQEVFDKARKNNTAEYFGYLAEQYSVDPGSQALRGEIPPIQKWGGQPNLEAEAFSLKPGQLSGVIQIEDKYVILRCEGFTQPVVKVELTDERIRNELYHVLYEKKLRLEMAKYFENLLAAAEISNYLTGSNHEPRRRGPAAAEALRPSPAKG